jgi:hypothetical protein
MRTELPFILVVWMVMSLYGECAEAQALTSSRDLGLRIEWTAEPAQGQLQRVCGYIYNDTPDVPREIRLLVEGRDTSDRIIDSRIAHVLRYIGPWGRTSFCSTAPAGAARYSVTLLGAQWANDR